MHQNHSHSARVNTRRSKKTQAAKTARLIQPVFEVLEARQLLSTSVSLSNGVLNVQGDSKAANHLTVSLDASGKTLSASAGQGKSGNYALSSVKQISITGGAGADYIYVDQNIKLPVTINSGDGNDEIRGGGGNNTISTGNGNSWISTRGASYVKAGNGNNTILANSGSNTLIAGDGNNTIMGGSGDDHIVVGNGQNSVNGGAGNDIITAGNGNNTLNGSLGDDQLVAGTGVNTFIPGSGNNSIVVANPKDTIVPSAGKNTIIQAQAQQTANNASETAGSTAPAISSSTANSVSLVNGVLYIQGDTKLASHLTASLDSSGKNISASADRGHIGTFSLSSVKQISITGGAGADYIYVDQNIKLPVTINSGDGNDEIRGGGGSNTIYTGNGNSWISTRGTTSYVKAGNGNNTILASGTNNTLIAGDGNNTVTGSDGNDNITVGNGRNNVNAGSGNDTITAGNGDNTLNGGLGDDRITVGTGNSTIIPGSGTNYMVLGNPRDTVVPSAGKNTVVNASGQPIAGNSSENSNPTPSQPSTPTPVPTPSPAGSNSWISYSASASSDKTAPRAVMQVLAPVQMVGIAVNVRALNSTTGAGSPITTNYQWDFGDPNGEYNQLPGFNASHIYDHAGTYTIKLTVTNQLGKTSVVSTKLTIAADNRRQIYVDAVNGNDSNNGATPNTAVRTTARADALLGNNTDVFFHQGQTFNMTQTFTNTFSNVVVSSYGSGSKPVMMLNTTNANPVQFSTWTSSAGVTIQNLAFDTRVNNRAFAIVPRGTNITIKDCTFLHVAYAVNANTSPTGLTVQDNTSPNADGIEGYFLWDEGVDTVVLGNTVANSVHEHVMRTSSASEILTYDNNFTNTDGKGCIEIHNGAYAWIEDNTVNTGDIRVGPLGLWGESPSSATDYAVIQGNTTINAPINVNPGSHHISIRDNVIQRDTSGMINIWSIDSAGRYCSDIQILNNTGISNAAYGNFLQVQSHTQGITLANNLLVQPNLQTGGYNSAPVYVNENNLSSFTYIGGNVWQMPKVITPYADGGINFVGTSNNGQAYLTPAKWNAQSQVHGDLFSSTPINYSSYAPSASSMAATAANSVAGVFTDLYGKPTPTSGKWSAGAVQV